MATDNYALALNAARKYKETAYTEGSNHAKCRQLHEDIVGWVGYTVGEVGARRILIPDEIRAEMGLKPNTKTT